MPVKSPLCFSTIMRRLVPGLRNVSLTRRSRRLPRVALVGDPSPLPHLDAGLRGGRRGTNRKGDGGAMPGRWVPKSVEALCSSRSSSEGQPLVPTIPARACARTSRASKSVQLRRSRRAEREGLVERRGPRFHGGDDLAGVVLGVAVVDDRPLDDGGRERTFGSLAGIGLDGKCGPTWSGRPGHRRDR